MGTDNRQMMEAGRSVVDLTLDKPGLLAVAAGGSGCKRRRELGQTESPYHRDQPQSRQQAGRLPWRLGQ